MKLVIVESPAKCKTIEKYLGNEYTVVASLGHIRDLATTGKGGLGVDVDNDFSASYIINKDKRKVVNDLLKQKRESTDVILATDPDREGEAIAWHLAQVLNLDIATTKRLEFHEITRDSISEAMSNPRVIDTNLVSSQETRRILDRIIGFKLSNLLFKKIHSRSAGRVQSATLKLIYDHEKEIEAFVSEEYWKVKVLADILGKEFSLKILNKQNKEFDINNKQECDDVLNNIGDEIEIISLDTINRVKDSKEPFTTSTMQQEAFAKLKFKTKKTQSIAQQLYEGVVVNGEHVGLITYMRTDSPRLAPSFVEKATAFINEKYGSEYLGHIKKGKKSVLSQDAHEGIRPTSCSRTPESIRQFLTSDQYNLYKLIYNRALGSLMAPKVEKVLSIIFTDNSYNYSMELSHTSFRGFDIIYKDDESEDYLNKLPEKVVDELKELMTYKEDTAGGIMNPKVLTVQKDMSIDEIQDTIIDEFACFDDWMDRYSLLIDYGNSLEAFPESERNDKNLIDGCQSRVWFTAEMDGTVVVYHGDSDAILVKGIVALLIRVLSGHTPKEIVDADLHFIDDIQLREHLSPTRSNGLNAMLKQMRLFALAYLSSGKQ